jgi:hypothetical protein
MSMSKSSLPAATTSSPLTFATPSSPPSSTPSPSLRPARLLPLALLALPLGLVCASCLNPQDDYDAYVVRAADAQAPVVPVGTGDASTVDVASLRAPDAGFDDPSFAMICLSQLAEDVTKALLWKVELKYVGGSAGGTLTYTSHSLAAGSTDVKNPLDPQVGPITGKIDPTGAGPIDINSTVLPAAANGITGAQVPLENAQVFFHIESPTQICANLGANVTAPAPVTLVPSQNPCIYLPTNSAGQWGPVTTADIHCP